MAEEQEQLVTMESLKQAYNTLSQQGKEAYARVKAVQEEYEQGKKSLIDLGLLPSPEGQEPGGRWVPVWGQGRKIVLVWYPANRHWHPDFFVRDYPLWIPLVKAGSGMLLSTRLVQLFEATRATETEIRSMAAADSGPLPTDNPTEETRQYIARKLAIAAAAHYLDGNKYSTARNEILGEAEQLGLCIAGDENACANRILAPSPSMERQALINLYLETGGVQKMANGQDALTSDPAATGYQSCFSMDQTQQGACLAQYANDPNYQAASEVFFNPWRPNIDPTKKLQVVKGIDGASYAVMKSGDNFKGVKITFAITTGMAVLVGGLATFAAVGFLWHSREGKKWKKSKFG